MKNQKGFLIRFKNDNKTKRMFKTWKHTVKDKYTFEPGSLVLVIHILNNGLYKLFHKNKIQYMNDICVNRYSKLIV